MTEEPDNNFLEWGRKMKKKARIMVVDDNEAMRESLRLILSAEGYEVVTVERGLQALARLGENSFDLVLTDLAMPGMSGLELLGNIRAIAPQTAVVVVTGQTSLPSALMALQRGASDYLDKTMSAEEMLSVIRKTLR